MGHVNILKLATKLFKKLLDLLKNSGVTRPFLVANAQGLFQNAHGLFPRVRKAFKPSYS